MWPLHSWLPDAHVEAPTAGSVILAGVLLKMGTYGFLRFNIPLFPQAAVQLAPWIALLAVIGILYGAAGFLRPKGCQEAGGLFFGQPPGVCDARSVRPQPQGIQGGILQMVNHGLSTGALFLIVGMIYERRHTRDMDAFGGLWKVMPVYAVLTLIVPCLRWACPA
jgi:NADH-quinone oxidoreductase subunit M